MSSQELIVKQQKLSTQTVKVGGLGQIDFARNVTELPKIRDLDRSVVWQELAMIFTKVTNLLGLKDEISQINKQDITEMIEFKYKYLSTKEIDYAFKLERYNMLGEVTEHFHLFNSVYVAKVLDKYKSWLIKTRKKYNLNNNSVTESSKLSDLEKEQIVLGGVKSFYKEYKDCGDFNALGRSYYYDFLDSKGVMPKDKKTKQNILKIARVNLSTKKKLSGSNYDVLIKGMDNNVLIAECKAISIKNLFDSVSCFSEIENIIYEKEKY